MTETILALLAILGVPAALVTLTVLAALAIARWQRTPGRTVPPGGMDPLARQAWIIAYQANIRAARFEQRVEDLEARTGSSSGGWGDDDQ